MTMATITDKDWDFLNESIELADNNKESVSDIYIENLINDYFESEILLDKEESKAEVLDLDSDLLLDKPLKTLTKELKPINSLKKIPTPSDSKNWYENSVYLQRIYETDYSKELVAFPHTWQELQKWFNHIDENVSTIELSALIKRIKIDDLVCKNNAREFLAKNKILSKRDFDQIWSKRSGRRTKKTKIVEKQVQKKLTKEEIKAGEEWLNLPDEERINEICEILDFYIVGKKEINKGLLIFLLKLGDILQKELISFVDFKGESSAGKSYICDNAVKILPEDKIYILDSGSDKALHYDELLKGKRFIYIREMKKNLNLIEELKSTFDYDPIIKTVEKDEETGHFITRTIKNEKMGLLTTYSFEFTQRDLANRSWTFTPNQSYKQNERVINFQIEKQQNKIKYDLIELKMEKKRKSIQNALSLLENNLIPYIAYAKHLKPLFSKKNLRIRRDVEKIYKLIGIITLFNQKNRKTLKIKEIGKKYIFSEYNDLALALKIAKEYFLELTQDLDQLKKDILDFMNIDGIDEYDKKTNEEINRNYKLKDISEEMLKINSIHSRTISRKLKSLSYDGYIEMIKKGKGKALEYKKLKGYDELDVNLEDIKDEINELVKKEYNNHFNKN